MRRFFLLLIVTLFGSNIFAQSESTTMATNLSQVYSWDKYPTYSTYVSFMQFYADNYPNLCRLDTIATTDNEHLILALKIGSNATSEDTKPKFFYTSSMHGDELTGAIMLMRLIDTLITHSDNFSSLINTINIYINPFANPDGTWYAGDNTVSSAMRYNANWVDINRNFPDIRYGTNYSEEPLQLETQAFMLYALKNRFNLSCNLHGGSEVFNYPFDSYTSEQKTHADKSWFETLGRDFVAKLQGRANGYFSDVSSSGIIDGGDWYTVFGGRQDWHTYFAHCREVTLEVSSQKKPQSNTLPIYWEYLKQSLFVFFDYAQKGFEGVITDSISHMPLSDVRVEINDYDRDSSEVFTNLSGYYFRPVLSGTYSVSFYKEGYYTKTINISSNDSLSRYDVELSPTNVSMEDITFTWPQIYPLPLKNDLVICYAANTLYQILDLQGRILLSGKIKSPVERINTKCLSSGTYILNLIYPNNKTISKKLIKQQ